MATRHQVRECVISLLYAKDIGNSDINKYIDELLEDKKIRNKQKEFALELYHGVDQDIQTLDSKIDAHLKEWKIKDLGHIERSILRMGAYEILNSSLDDAVIINEAIELSKSLAAESAPKFIHGVLDAIVKENKK